MTREEARRLAYDPARPGEARRHELAKRAVGPSPAWAPDEGAEWRTPLTLEEWVEFDALQREYFALLMCAFPPQRRQP